MASWNKKAQMLQETPVSIVLLVVAGIGVIVIICLLLIPIILAFFQGNTCKLSISSSAAIGQLNLNCKPVRSEIKRTDFKEGASATELEELVKKAIADKMWACWDTVDKGSLNPYKSTYETGAALSTKKVKVTAYLICEIITFKDIPNFRGFNEWLTLPSSKPTPTKVNYFSYLYGRAPTPDETKQFALKEDLYFTSDTYVVAWKHVARAGSDTPDSIVFERYADLLNSPNSASSMSVVVN